MRSTPLLCSLAILVIAPFVAFAQTPAPSAAAEATQAVESAHTDAKGRHLAPRGTFYMLAYVAAKTPSGVEGFDPGTEVHFVEVHRPTRTLVVSDGHAQVEVSPGNLTNDLDIAALVRQKDQANQAQVSAYIQAEQVAYNQYEREAADATAKDLEHTRDLQQKQAAELRKREQTPVAQTAEPVYASTNNNGGYYGDGGYGYGNAYSYFVDTSAPAANQGTATTQAPTNARPASPAATSGNSAVAPAAPAAVGHAK